MIVVNEVISCSNCHKPLLRSFRYEKNTSWSPNVHPCERCNQRMFSWNIFSKQLPNGKILLPLNEFQFKRLMGDLKEGNAGYLPEDPLIVSESEYEEYREVFDTDGLYLIKKIYEHKNKINKKLLN